MNREAKGGGGVERQIFDREKENEEEEKVIGKNIRKRRDNLQGKMYKKLYKVLEEWENIQEK